jgi:hypothetical protein
MNQTVANGDLGSLLKQLNYCLGQRWRANAETFKLAHTANRTDTQTQAT